MGPLPAVPRLHGPGDGGDRSRHRRPRDCRPACWPAACSPIRWPFLARYWVGRNRRRLKAGEYLFDRPLRPLDVYRKLVAGDVYLYSVVVPEGSDRFDIARILAERLAIDPDDFLSRTEQTSLIHDLDPEAPTLEGYLFPDTYRFPRAGNGRNGDRHHGRSLPARAANTVS